MKTNLTEEEFLNRWLGKCFDTNLAEVKEAHPEWDDNSSEHSRDFYREYAVTQEEHDEWYTWAVDRVAKHYGYGKKYAKRAFSIPYLNVAPSIKED